MSIRTEINKYSKEEDIPILLWLFERYHFESEWRFVARCNFLRYGNLSYEAYRVWSPTKEGIALYYGLKTEKKLLSEIKEWASREVEYRSNENSDYFEGYWDGYKDGMISFSKRLLNIINENES